MELPAVRTALAPWPGHPGIGPGRDLPGGARAVDSTFVHRISDHVNVAARSCRPCIVHRYGRSPRKFLVTCVTVEDVYLGRPSGWPLPPSLWWGDVPRACRRRSLRPGVEVSAPPCATSRKMAGQRACSPPARRVDESVPAHPPRRAGPSPEFVGRQNFGDSSCRCTRCRYHSGVSGDRRTSLGVQSVPG